MTKSRLARILKHLVYDGVYADVEERIAGGGCLELKKHVIKELGLNSNSITGNWDYAHNMQLVFNDTLKKKPFILKIINTYFRAMKSMNCGKAATVFKEAASELENMVLTNKTYQTTRFVRSLQRGNTTALRNLPTLVNVVAKDGNKKKTLRALKSAKTLFFSIGLGQLLESYAEASLVVQYSNHFPIQV